MEYLAHIADDGRVQTVSEHLHGTGELAAGFAAPFGASDEARAAGLLHDIGKYSAAFQQRIRGSAVSVDHSTAGAQEARNRRDLPAALAIAGHHGGIPDCGNLNDAADDTTLQGRLKRKLPTYDEWQREITPPSAKPPAWALSDSTTAAFYTRMLYSCLVDADFQDTQDFMDGQAAQRGGGESISALLEKVRAKAKGYLEKPKSSVASQRNAALRACMERGAQWEQGMYTLTVPTGGGKTFASLAFALEHAAAHGMSRVIYVIPYTSIIDQTAGVFAELLGEENVLAHYSAAEYLLAESEDLTPAQYRKLLASENWDAPIVVTTAVQFFESLYSNRSSRCRKLHNIANSVIIFDAYEIIGLNQKSLINQGLDWLRPIFLTQKEAMKMSIRRFYEQRRKSAA